jgi:hypothetical protein
MRRFRPGARGIVLSASLGLAGLAGLAGVLESAGWFPLEGSDLASAAQSSGHAKPLTPTEQAKAALLTKAEMPAGWTASATGGKVTHTAPLTAAIATCIGVSSSVARVKPLKVSSPDFTSPDRSSAVEDSASVYATTGQAAAAYKALANEKTPSCMGRLGAAALQTSVQAEAGPDATVDSISISPLPAGVAERGQTGFMVKIPLTLHGKDLTITSTQIDVQKGKLLQQLTFNGNGAPFTPLEQVHLLMITTGHA